MTVAGFRRSNQIPARHKAGSSAGCPFPRGPSACGGRTGGTHTNRTSILIIIHGIKIVVNLFDEISFGDLRLFLQIGLRILTTETLHTKDFDFDLPQELIAQTPIEPRDASRLMVLDKKTGASSTGISTTLSSI